MSSPTLDQVLAAMKRALESIDGLRAHAVEPDEPNFPCAFPRLIDWSYDETFPMDCDDRPTMYHFDLWVLVDLKSGLPRAQAQLNPFISPVGRKSIKQALERDERLGGCIDWIRLTGGGSYGTTTIGSLTALAASMRAEVHA
jgi:hypothetical protein